MSKVMRFFPQKVFAPAYYTDVKDIVKHRTLFRPEYTYFVDEGGRGGGKTKDKVKAIVFEASIRPVRVLVTRELQNSIEESVKAEIEACIFEEGLEHFFDITQSSINGKNGSRFIFKGLKNNINNLKSIADVDIVLVEEAENVTKDSWEKLLPSIRPISGRAIVVVIFNPANELDDTYQRWIVNTPPRTLVTTVNWNQNKYFPAFLEEQRQHALKTLPKKEYDHIWEGKPKGSNDDVIVDLAWIKAARFASKHPDWKAEGKSIVGYDPAGQGRDSNACVFSEKGCIVDVDEWVKSPDLKEASRRAFKMAIKHKAEFFMFDECGGYGDGVTVFIKEAKMEAIKEFNRDKKKVHSARLSRLSVKGFNAGNPVHKPKQKIRGTGKNNEQVYSNLKAQAHGVIAQQFYNTYRFIVLGERDIDFKDMISIDIEDDEMFNKIAREASTPIWIKSITNSKKKVEAKKDMEKRTGQASPNIWDSIVMTRSPALPTASAADIL